jgi:hypothetical protein
MPPFTPRRTSFGTLRQAAVDVDFAVADARTADADAVRCHHERRGVDLEWPEAVVDPLSVSSTIS